MSQTFAKGFAPTNPQEYNDEVDARCTLMPHLMGVTRATLKARLDPIYEVVNVATLCRESGISRSFIERLAAGDGSGERQVVNPNMKLTIWLDKYEQQYLNTKDAILAKRAKFKEYNQRRASAPDRTRAEVLTLIATADAKFSGCDTTQLATLARKLATIVRERNGATAPTPQPTKETS